METYHTITTTLAVLCLLLTTTASEPLRVRRDANATGPAVKEEELATQRELLLLFRDRVYGELEKILRGIADIQNRLNGGSGVPITPSVPTTTTTPPTKSPFIRLVNGSNTFEGRVEVLVGQSWGTVCDDRWDSQDVSVVCGMLGYSRENALPVVQASFGRGSGPIIFDGLNCEGNEEDIRLCPMDNLPFNGNCDHSEDAGVICRPLN